MTGPEQIEDAAPGEGHNSDRTHRSSLVEKALEYRFLADLTAELLQRGWSHEVLRADVDRDGYDLVVEANGTMRHIQLKALAEGGRRANVTVNTSLTRKPSPCVIWMVYDPATLLLRSFRWLGGFPGDAMPPIGDQVARHSKANAAGVKAERAAHRVVPGGRFLAVATMHELTDRLFGAADERAMLRRHIAALPAGDGPYWLARVRAGDFTAIPCDLDWNSSVELAHLVDGYALLGTSRTDDADIWITTRADHSRRSGFWRGGPVELWTTLFIEHRRQKFAGVFASDTGDTKLLDRLVHQLHEALN